MKQRVVLILLALFVLHGAGMNTMAAPTPESVKAITKKVADWQIETFEDQVKYRAVGR